jgi:hypothetical protein
MRIKQGFVLRDVCGEKVIVGEGLGAVNFGKLLSLNETAAWLWEQAVAIGDFNVEQLTQKLCEEYEVAADEARNDITAMINEWNSIGVIDNYE